MFCGSFLICCCFETRFKDASNGSQEVILIPIDLLLHITGKILPLEFPENSNDLWKFSQGILLKDTGDSSIHFLIHGTRIPNSHKKKSRSFIPLKHLWILQN